ncbi:MAG: hypothetical protein WCP09_03905 [Candidatus Taylorbacteria bacterium]
MSKTFSIESPEQKEGSHYQQDILKIINHIETQVRAIEPDALMHGELHTKRIIDSRSEVREFEDVRKDVCESFGVPADEEHVYMYNNPTANEQRALRAFFVLIDAISKEAFYGEGRIDHITLYRKLCEKLAVFDPKADFETISQDESVPQRYLTFKGFVSTREFAELSESNRRVLETPIVDESGAKIETPKTWFVTGHNLPEGNESHIVPS